MHPDDRVLLTEKEAYYSRFDPDEFLARRAQFETLDLSDPEVDAPAEVRRVIQAGNGETLLRSFSWDAWFPGQVQLWRARRISSAKALYGYWVDDLWEPPSQLASSGRFNMQGESMFYACIGGESLAPMTALLEARVGHGDAFILMKYALTSGELRTSRVGVPNAQPGLRSNHRLIEREVNEFIVDAIRTPAPHDRGPGTYRFTRQLLHDLYPLGSREVGWNYESVQIPGGLNIALPPTTARRLLELRGVIVGRLLIEHGLHSVEIYDWTTDCTPVDSDGRIGFPTFGREAPGDLLPFGVLPD